jgi:hypothetical protein
MIIAMEDYISKHPLFERWKTLRRRGVLCAEWHESARAFVNGVGDRPEGYKKLRRIRQDKPYSPDNFAWGKTPTREETLAYYKEWNRRNPEKVRDTKYRRYYGITHADYERMLAAQDGKCAICAKQESRFIRRRAEQPRNLCVDHDHSTGEIRGLLCADCNVALGAMDDDPARLFAAIQYLAKWAKVPKVS